MSLFKKFFNNVIHDRDPDDDTDMIKGQPKPKYHGTVVPYPNFDPTTDVSLLKSAIDTDDVGESVIVALLVKRSNEQRQMIQTVYEVTNEEKLDEALKSALRSDLEDVTLALLMTPARYDAYLLKKAMEGMGTDEDLLVEVLVTRSNEQIQEIKRVFKEVYEEELEDVIRDDTSGDFTEALLAMLKADRDESGEVDMHLAETDAKTLFEAGENISGINVSTFIDILTSRSGRQLCKTFQHYASISDVTLPKALDMELSGDIEKCLVDIVKCAWNTPAFFAEKLHKALEGFGTNEETLIRVLVSRSEVDLKKIVEEYRAMYDISLQEHILKDTDGHYQTVLLGLCGAY